MFKALIGRGHPEFSTMRQQVRLIIIYSSQIIVNVQCMEHDIVWWASLFQDAQEFFLHLLTIIDKSQRSSAGPLNPVDTFRYQVCGKEKDSAFK